MTKVRCYPARCYPAILALACSALAACRPGGSFQVSWHFADQAQGALFTARDCGLHGVESFNVTASSDGGDSSGFRVLCGPGSESHEVPPGRWIVALEALDAGNHGPRPDEDPHVLRGSSAAFDVVADAPPVAVSVVVIPRDSCHDGVDNDGDGAVDLDDSDCRGEVPSEIKPATH